MNHHLKAANDWRRIRKTGMYLMDLAQGKPPHVQAAIHVAILEVIATVVTA